MPQITIFLDDKTRSKIQKRVQQEGVSQEEWIRKIIHEKLATEWPPEVIQLAGAWKDFPSLDEIRTGLSQDVTREML